MNSYFNVCKNLVAADLRIFRRTFVDKYIDVSIWVILTILVTGYIMPYFGLTHDFGVFQLGGIIAAVGLFELYTSVVELVSDFEGDRTINYNLTLPIPSWLAIVSKGFYFFLVYVALALFVLPLGKLCLWYQLDLTSIDYVKLLGAILCQSVFFACFVLWAASIVRNMTDMGKVWSRFVFPMWFMGGFQFSWFSLYNVLPVIAYINLLNPMMFITEAIRVSILGQAEYLNYWLCLVVIILFSLFFFTWGLRILKRRLDFL